MVVSSLLLLALPVLAETEPVTCPEGTYWVSENAWVEETTTQGACNSWSTPECTSYQTVCTRYVTACSGPWWNRHCHDTCVQTAQVCNSWTTPVCTGYATDIVPGHYQEGGQCLPGVDPRVETVENGGISLLQMLPKIENDNNLKVTVVGKQITVNFLSNYFASGAVIYGTESQDYAVSSFGWCTWDGVGEAVNLGGNYWGYSNIAHETGKATYHTVSFVVPNAGTYYLRTLLFNADSPVKTSNYVMGGELSVIVK